MEHKRNNFFLYFRGGCYFWKFVSLFRPLVAADLLRAPASVRPRIQTAPSRLWDRERQTLLSPPGSDQSDAFAALRQFRDRHWQMRCTDRPLLCRTPRQICQGKNPRKETFINVVANLSNCPLLQLLLNLHLQVRILRRTRRVTPPDAGKKRNRRGPGSVFPQSAREFVRSWRCLRRCPSRRKCWDGRPTGRWPRPTCQAPYWPVHCKWLLAFRRRRRPR